MKPWFSFVGLCCALVLLNPPAASAADTNLLVGTWETQWTGPSGDRATCYLTFSNDFSWSGYGIALRSFGPVTITGTWGVDSKDKITGSFTEYRDVGDISGTLTKFVAGHNKISGRAFAAQGHTAIKGSALSTPPDVSGDWTGEVHTGGNTRNQAYTFTASTNTAGWFDITGTGVGQSGVYTIGGALVVTSDRSANGYLVSEFGTANTTSTWSLAGKFLPALQRGTFRGRTDDGHAVVIHTTKQ